MGVRIKLKPWGDRQRVTDMAGVVNKSGQEQEQEQEKAYWSLLIFHFSFSVYL
ncbi:MAG TPA: hypothetical protein VIX17_17955 [Pyrinomonadaceae bacterium]|jgi:hypothetical protein